jgi:chromosome segregation ATPase
MKKISLIVISLLFIIPAIAQKTKVEESSEKIADGKNNTLVVWIREADKKDVEKEWVSLMKKNKAKVSSKKEIFADDAVLPLISSNTVDVYAIVEQKDNDVKLIVAFDLGGAFLNSKEHSAQFKAAERMVYDFAVEISKQNVQNTIAAEQKKMSDLEKKKDNLEKDTKKKEKEIEDYKKKIEDNENAIKTNSSDIETLNKEMNDQKSVIEALEKKFKAID